ncbi:MAG: hypothetical protein ACOY4R_22880 [Pseudomonadota bacterium]
MLRLFSFRPFAVIRDRLPGAGLLLMLAATLSATWPPASGTGARSVIAHGRNPPH